MTRNAAGSAPICGPWWTGGKHDESILEVNTFLLLAALLVVGAMVFGIARNW